MVTKANLTGRSFVRTTIYLSDSAIAEVRMQNVATIVVSDGCTSGKPPPAFKAIPIEARSKFPGHN